MGTQPFADRVIVRQLASGARLAVLANPYAPTVTVAGALQAGHAWSADGRFAVAGMTAAMLDRGTAHHDRLALATELENRGLQLAVETSSAAPTQVFFSAQGLAEELPRLGSLLFDVLRRPTFPEVELAKLKERVAGALQREAQSTFARAYSALTRSLYPEGHPLRRRDIEQRLQEVEALVPQDLRSFHAATYQPDGMFMVVVGQVDPQQVVDLVAELVEGWHGGQRAAPPWPAARSEVVGDQRVELEDRPNLDVFLGHAGRLRMADDDFAAAILANSCLGQSALTSRLGAEIRDREGLTYGVVSRFFGTLEPPGPWATHLSVSAANLERAVRRAREVIGDYVEAGPDEDELEDERQALAGAYQVQLATNAGIARELVTVLSAGLPVEFLDTYPDVLRSTSGEQVLAALRRHIRPPELALSVAGSLDPG